VIVDDAVTLAAVESAFDRYEAALATNDVAALDGFFFDSPHTLRYGVGENLYGFAAIAAFRLARPGGSPPRRIVRRVITTYGSDFATANIEFQREGGGRIGRQSQTWVRFEVGWRIVAAHVSLMGETS
jgi:hypothetical protein